MAAHPPPFGAATGPYWVPHQPWKAEGPLGKQAGHLSSVRSTPPLRSWGASWRLWLLSVLLRTELRLSFCDSQAIRLSLGLGNKHDSLLLSHAWLGLSLPAVWGTLRGRSGNGDGKDASAVVWARQGWPGSLEVMRRQAEEKFCVR